MRERSKERKRGSEEKSTGKKSSGKGKRHSRSGSREKQPVGTNVITSVDLEEYAENHPATMIPVKDLDGNNRSLDSSHGVRERQRLT